MNIALLTIWHEGNYGAELQTYATIKILQQLGHNVKLVDIRLSDISTKSFRGIIGGFLSSFGPSQKKFENFWKKYFPKTRRYHKVSELIDCPPKADVYMVGSDQVWNPEITRSLSEIFFLNFGSNSVKRISYASSFGTDCWNGYKTEEIKCLLQRFQAISCRENSGIKILNDVFGCQATNVLDPTLLFDGYKELTGDLREEDTLVYYPLDSFPQLSEFAIQTANNLGLTPKNANWQTYIYGTAVWDRNSVEGWIRDIAQAKFVITPSFHGLAMSIIHHRQFAVIVKDYKRATRMRSLLENLGLTDRIFSSFEEIQLSRPWEKIIDYKLVDAKIATLREISLNYLNKCL